MALLSWMKLTGNQIPLKMEAPVFLPEFFCGRLLNCKYSIFTRIKNNHAFKAR